MERRALVRDGWVPTLLTALAVAEVLLAYRDHPAGRVSLLTVLVPMALTMAGRRRSPVLVAVAETVLVAVLVLAVLPSLAEQPPLTPFLCLLVALFHLGAHGAGRVFLVGAVGVGAALAGLQVAGLAAGQHLGDVIPSLLFFAGAFGLGRVLHATHDQAASARERAEAAELSREEHAREAVEAERARIARELHDVVAHALTGIVVQASVETRLRPDDGSTTTVLRAIERQGREAMVELRRLLGLLREDGQGPADAPLPSLARAEALVDDLRRAGHQVAFERCGDLADLPTGVDLTAYRVLQEALTNVARHAPGASVRVCLDRVGSEVTVRVDSEAGNGSGHGLGSGGHGLTGMHERVRLYDGRLHAEPCPGGGFRLHARLPIGEGGGA